MGLDITAYRKVEPVRDATPDDEGEELVSFCNFQAFPGRFEGLQEGMLYRYVESHGFRAGSYSGYGAWREWLAKLAGYPAVEEREDGCIRHLHAAACWNGATGPFSELINFADNEGTIGPVVAAKLAKDFADFDERAKAADPEGYNYSRYQEWRKAMEMAADGGAVDFH